jgi:hypothetical protein
MKNANDCRLQQTWIFQRVSKYFLHQIRHVTSKITKQDLFSYHRHLLLLYKSFSVRRLNSLSAVLYRGKYLRMNIFCCLGSLSCIVADRSIPYCSWTIRVSTFITQVGIGHYPKPFRCVLTLKNLFLILCRHFNNLFWSCSDTLATFSYLVQTS